VLSGFNYPRRGSSGGTVTHSRKVIRKGENYALVRTACVCQVEIIVRIPAQNVKKNGEVKSGQHNHRLIKAKSTFIGDTHRRTKKGKEP